jgi:hypothetical protein
MGETASRLDLLRDRTRLFAQRFTSVGQIDKRAGNFSRPLLIISSSTANDAFTYSRAG